MDKENQKTDVKQLIRSIFGSAAYMISIDRSNREYPQATEIRDQIGCIPPKNELIAIRDYVNKILKIKDIEIVIKKHNDDLIQEYSHPPKSLQPKIQQKKITPGFIYFLQDDQKRIKIGKTKVLDNRILHLGITLPQIPILFHSIKVQNIHKLEKHFHKKYQKYRLNGEWFQLPEKELMFIKTL